MKQFLASVLLHGYPLPFESIEGVLAKTGAQPAPRRQRPAGRTRRAAAVGRATARPARR
ncbi:hypothetical protein [Cognatiluteimonas weifangensis]|uniref:hypothetical protein n=1 Tax=Cognatiluteimonas weifangensis TaxID=2303539 RepID=UPI001314BCAC|nr:hypothetical protein [Luteimonas weifangensis]